MAFVVMATGCCLIVFRAPSRMPLNPWCRLGWLLTGCAAALTGWLIIIFQDELLAFAENASGFFGISGVSAPSYGRAENIRIGAVIVAELELRDVA
jgi:hypothetical protein